MADVDAGRLARAVWLDVRCFGRPGLYEVRGGSRMHIVDVTAGSYYCDCEDHQWRGQGLCKHIAAVKLREGDPELIRALRQLIPRPARRPAGAREVLA